MQQLTPFDLLTHCAIKMNLARIDAEARGTSYDRNRLAYQYFTQKKLRPPKGAEGMVKTITRNIKYAGYAFDQYFQLYMGTKPTPDCNPIGDKIKEGLLNDYGVTIEEVNNAATAII
jgi:hypothetical protein